MAIVVECTIHLIEREGRWRIRMQWDNGAWFISEDSYPSEDDATVAFYKWRHQINAEVLTKN